MRKESMANSSFYISESSDKNDKKALKLLEEELADSFRFLPVAQ